MSKEAAVEQYRSLVFAAHRRVANRGNLSGEVFIQAFIANGQRFFPAVSAALGTLGGIHGPVDMAHVYLETSEDGSVEMALSRGGRVPGWGSSFVKDKFDPDWIEAHNFLPEVSLTLAAALHRTTREFKECGKPLYPNAAAYTACLSIVMGLPSQLAPSLFLEARLPAWRDHLHKTMTTEN